MAGEKEDDGEMAPPQNPSIQSGQPSIQSGQPSQPPSTEPTEQRTSNKATSKEPPKGGRKPSNVWDHFDKFNDEDGRDKAKCKYCPKSYFCNSRTNGTTALLTHMGKCKNHPCSMDLRQSQLSLQPILDEGGDESVVVGNLTSWRFDQEYCRVKLVEMIIKDELSFKIVEGEGFKEFVAALQPKFKLPSRWTISRDIYKLFEAERVRLKEISTNLVKVSLLLQTLGHLCKGSIICALLHIGLMRSGN